MHLKAFLGIETACQWAEPVKDQVRLSDPATGQSANSCTALTVLERAPPHRRQAD